MVEVILGDEHHMSDLFTASEEALARLALAEVTAQAPRVLVGGLGLGYTAVPPSIPRRRRRSGDRLLGAGHRLAPPGILPIGRRLADGRGAAWWKGTFWRQPAELDPTRPGQRYDAVLLDIDHSPDFHLNPSHAGFYGPAGLARLAGQLTAGGVFALWSTTARTRRSPTLAACLPTRAARSAVSKPLLGREEVQTVYLAGAAPAPKPI